MQHTDIPSKVIQAETKARESGLTIVNVQYQSRTIEVEGMLSEDNREDFVNKIDEMKLNLNGASGVLDIAYGNGTRRYYATVERLELPEDFYNISYGRYKITFFCADPFGYTTTSGNLSIMGITNMLNDTLITLSGSIDTEPVVQLTINVATNWQMIELSNQNTNETIIVSKPTGNFSASDVVIIDSKRKLVFVNNSGIDYTGRFPTLKADGSEQRLRVSTIADAVDYDLVVTYSPRFL